MSRDLHLLRSWGQVTAPEPSHVRGVMDRLRDRGCLGSRADDALHVLHAPGTSDLARTREALVRRLASARRTGRGVSVPRRQAVVLAAALAAAVLTFVLLPRPDRILSERLVSPVAWQERAPTADVALRFQGRGSLSGTAHAPEIAWEAGRLEVSVVPGREIQLVVETREAQVRVTGTAFSVERSALGSVVAVDRGAVQVACRGTTPIPVGSGGRQLCPPVSAAGWMARANLLRDPGEVLASAEAGLAYRDAPGAVMDELGAIRILALTELSRDAEALDAAEAYLGRDHPTREDEIRRLAIRLARRVGGCARARLHIEALAADDADAAALLAACAGGGPP